MKHLTILLLFLTSSTFHSTAQRTEKVEPDTIFELLDVQRIESDTIFEHLDVQKLPAFPGGEAELAKFLQENINYPAIARENNIQGTAALSFVVGKDGSIAAIRILKGNDEVAEELIRVIKSMPCWIPAERNGEPVSTQFTLPIRICLRN